MFKEEFNLNVDDFGMSSILTKVKEEGDGGVYIFNFLYKFLTERRITDVQFTDKDKKLFRFRTEWLVLKFWELFNSEAEERRRLEEEKRLMLEE